MSEEHPAPEPDPADERPSAASEVAPDRGIAPFGVMALAIAVALVIVAFGLTAGRGHTGESVPSPVGTVPDTPAKGEDASFDLTAALPEGAEALSGGFRPGPDGAVVSAEAEYPSNPLVGFDLDGPPWATVDVTGQAVDGWSVVFGLLDGGTYWTVTVNPGLKTVQLLHVVRGEPAEDVTYLVDGEVTGDVTITVRRRLVQVTASGVYMPTATVAAGAEMRFGLMGRRDAAAPGAATWRSIVVRADTPLRTPSLPPLLDARPADAAIVREELGQP